MGELDWLERGHGGGERLQPMIKGSARRVSERVSIRSVLRGADSSNPQHGTRRRTKALVGWLLYCCTAVGGTAAAFTVRDTLFPSLGKPTTRSLWVSAIPDTTPTTDGSTSSTKVDTTAVVTTVATTVPPTQSVEAQVVSAASLPGSNGPTNTIDDQGSNKGVPETGTTVAGPVSNGPSGPVTTVDDHGTDTSTASSASDPPASVDPTPTAASIPGSATTDTSPGHQSGKGGGSGGGTSIP